MNHRNVRVAALIKQELGKLMTQGEIKDPRMHGITITDVVVNPDLRKAWVYYSGPNNQVKRKEMAKGMDSVTGFIRKRLGAILKLRFTPELEFCPDEALEHGNRIETLLKKIEYSA